MSPPNWLPPVNSHHEFQVIPEAYAEIPEYDPYRPRPLYSIKILISIIFKSAEEKSNARSFQGLSCKKQLKIPSHYVDSESVFTERILDMLTRDETLIPFEIHIERLAYFVWEFACLMREKLRNVNPACYNILPFTLKITKEVKIPDSELKAWNSWYEEKKSADPDFEKDYKEAITRPRTMEELMYETSVRFRAANRSSIQELEVVRLDDCSSNNSCPICLEELVLESKVTRLRCSHVFHGDCIVKWLQESHMCPLCRFELPYDLVKI